MNFPALSTFGVDSVRGFLPSSDPTQKLPSSLQEAEALFEEVPKLLMTNQVRKILGRFPPVPLNGLSESQLERVMLGMSYVGHAYVWGEPTPTHTLPASIAKPWYEVSQKVGRLPVLSYASYALHNWKRIDPKGPIACGNIALVQTFWGGADEEWFILIHVDIEAKAARAMNAVPTVLNGVEAGDTKSIAEGLTIIRDSLLEMNVGLERMPEFCDPYIYYHRVRPYIHGWKNHPVLTNGLLYEGVDAFGGQPQQFRGETGAQSTIIPTLDGLLCIGHADDPLKSYLLEMREYMPRGHRALLEAVECGPNTRAFIEGQKGAEGTLKDLYNECVLLVERFRSTHLEYAANYIFKQGQKSSLNPTAVGTGGTPFMPYLSKHRDETTTHLLK